MYFDDDQTARLNRISHQIEAHTGVRLTTALVDRSDDYPEIAWKAFAAGICAHAVIYLLQILLLPYRPPVWSMPQLLGFVIGTSAAIALLTQVWPPFGRLFLHRALAETRTHRYAQSLFLENEIFKSQGENGILVLVSLFEHQVAIVPGNGVAALLDRSVREQVTDHMIPFLRRGDRFEAVAQGFIRLEAALAATGAQPCTPNGLPAARGILQLKGCMPARS